VEADSLGCILDVLSISNVITAWGDHFLGKQYVPQMHWECFVC
jgi:hypothetical protein